MTTRLLTPQNVCLQVVDVQQSLMVKISKAQHVADTVELMVDCAKILDVPVVANTQYKKGLGPYVVNVEAVVKDLTRIDKVEFNGAANIDNAAYFSALPETVTTIILVGVETHICIYQTALGLMDLGYNVWVVSDAVSSRSEENHLRGLERMQTLGASIGPAEMLIYELLGKAGTPEFKKILPFIVERSR